MYRLSHVLALAACSLALSAVAQTIERVKMTDNDLSCQQIYGEIIQMDGVIAKANQPALPGTAVPGGAPTASKSRDKRANAATEACSVAALCRQAAATGAFKSGGMFSSGSQSCSHAAPGCAPGSKATLP